MADPVRRSQVPLVGKLSEWSQVRAIGGTNESAEDLYGFARPVSNSKNSWGAIQFVGPTRSSIAVQEGAVSLELPDAGRMQFFIPTVNSQMTFVVQAYYQSAYAGTLPQMIIRQPGQSDDTTTDAGNSETFNRLATTLTPAANPPYIAMILASDNTATTGPYKIFFDAIETSVG